MADMVTFELVSPERILLSLQAEMVVLPGSEGDFAVLAGHQPTIAALKPGAIDVYEGTRVTDRVFVAGGFAELSQDRLTVLTEEATRFQEVDRAKLADRLEDAKDEVNAAGEDPVRREAAEARLAYLQLMSETTTLG